ncbi:hypothetical protein AC249_AIPGENE4365 [Exaiptasia diaphana]|nr:hypothetical protein AC249_AIPGENE4365 [Exaiptasia diaphana]
MTKDISKIQKENEVLKEKALEFEQELKEMRDKMAAMNNPPHKLDKSMPFLSDEFEGKGCQQNALKANNIDLEDIGLTKSTGKIGIYEHLTPSTQALFNKAKIFQKNKYAFCWTKNSNIFLKESQDSVVIRVTSPEVLENMVNDASISETPGISPGASMSFNTRSFRSRGRGGPRTRSTYNRDELSTVFGQLR